MSEDEIAMNIVDNTPKRELVRVIKDQLKKSKEAKFAIGYFFLSGFNLVKDDFPTEYEKLPFLKIVMGNETTYPTKEELAAGYDLREAFKQKMIEEIQGKELTEAQIEQLKKLRDFISNKIIDIKLFDKSRLHAKLYLFLTNPEEKYGSPGLAVVGSSNFTAEGLNKNKELNVLLSAREEVVYLNNWFDKLWEESLDFQEDLLKIIEISGILPESEYPKIGTYVDPYVLFKYLVYKWTEGRVLNLMEKDILMEFQLVGVINAINILNYYNGVILADSVGLGKSFMAGAIIQEFLYGKHPHWIPKSKEHPAVMIILPPSIISQWEDLLVGRADKSTLNRLKKGSKVKINSEFFFKDNLKRMVKGDYNYKIYEIYDEKGEKFLGKIGFLSLGLFQNYKVDLKNGQIDECLKKMKEEYDLFIIDEAHKYRNKNTRRWKAARALQSKSNRFPNKFLLLTATPLNNTIDDIYNLIRIFSDDTFMQFRFKNIDIDELKKTYRKLKHDYEETGDEGIKKELKKIATDIKMLVLDEVMVLRTRKYIAEQFKDLKINGKKLVFKDPEPYSLDYKPFYTSMFDELINKISQNISSINFEHTKLYGVRYVVFETEDEEEGGYRIIEVSDLFRLLLGKRLESGILPFETTLRKIYTKERIFYSIFKSNINSIMNEKDLENLVRKAVEEAKIKKDLDDVSTEFNAEAEEEDTWFDKVIQLLSEYLEEHHLETLDPVDRIKKGLEIVIHNIESDLKLMEEIFGILNKLKIKEDGEPKELGIIPKGIGDIVESKIFTYENDPKLEVLKQLIVNPKYKSEALFNVPSLNGKKFIIFTQYKDTAYYLYSNLKDWIEKEVDLHPWLKEKKTNKVKIALVTGETDTTTKINFIKRFSPQANAGEDEVVKYGEIDILISTDALSEGVNLQDADAVVNFDLPWNPMLIVQRVGRVNRIGNEKDVYVLNFIPSGEIEVLVGILNKLRQKIEDITLVVGKESRILSPDEEITVETFGERIKKISEFSISDLEEISISKEFKEWFGGGIPQQQIDEYKLLNAIQYNLGLTREDFEDVKDMKNEPYYSYVKSGNGKIYGIYEFYRGDYRIDKKIISVNDEIKFESPLVLLELVDNKKMSPVKLDIAAEKLKNIENKAKEEMEKLRKEYNPKQRGFLYYLLNALIVEREKAKGLENYKSVVNVLQLLPHYLYSKEIKSYLVERDLIEVDKKSNVNIKNLKGTVDSLYNLFFMLGISDIQSLKVRKHYLGWFYGY